MINNNYVFTPIMIDDGARMVRFTPEKVFTVLADGNYSDVYTDCNIRKKPLYTLSHKIGQLYEKLHDYGFVRINRSELINSAYVATITGYDIMMLDGSEHRIGKSYKDSVMEGFNILIMKR